MARPGRDFAYLNFMRPKRPGRACFACLCQHSRQAETAVKRHPQIRTRRVRSARIKSDMWKCRRGFPLRSASYEGQAGQAGRAMRHGAPACASHLSACGYAQEDADMAPSRVSGVARQSEDGTEHQRRRPFPTQPSPKRYGGHAERAKRAREVVHWKSTTCG